MKVDTGTTLALLEAANHETAEDDLNATALIREAHRRQRRRRLSFAVIVVIGLVGGSIAYWALQGPAHPSATGGFEAASAVLPTETPLDDTVLLSPQSGGESGADMIETDPVTGLSLPMTPFPADTWLTGPMIPVDGEVVVPDGGRVPSGPVAFPQLGTAAVFAPERASTMRVIGKASYIVSSPIDGAVWLLIGPDGGLLRPGESGCSAEEVALSGEVLIGPYPYPCSWSIVGPGPNGLLVENSVPADENLLRDWNPRTGGLGATYRLGSETLEVYGDAGNMLVSDCNVRAPCAEVTDLLTGRTVQLPPLPGGSFLSSDYTLSPDGRFVAVLAGSTSALGKPTVINHSEPCCYLGVRSIPSTLLLFSTRSGVLLESRPLNAASRSLLHWSPDGGYLFATLDLTDVEAVPMWSTSAAIRVISVASRRDRSLDSPAESFVPVAAPR